jgi:hypothetical protein
VFSSLNKFFTKKCKPNIRNNTLLINLWYWKTDLSALTVEVYNRVDTLRESAAGLSLIHSVQVVVERAVWVSPKSYDASNAHLVQIQRVAMPYCHTIPHHGKTLQYNNYFMFRL